MRLGVTSVMVENQDQALEFYTTILGFQKMADIPFGAMRWLTVVSPEAPEGMELVLEPMAFPPARTFQQALFEAGIPATAMFTEDIHVDHARLKSLGVVFRGEPTTMGPITAVVFEDSCGNLINLVQRIRY
jgi:catechol 2,3-dioxygenase-like lactoylglutathione lyase family enzyme